MNYIILATETNAFLLTENGIEIATQEIVVQLADVGGKKPKRKDRSFEEERRLRAQLRELIAKALEPETAEAEQIALVTEGRQVKIVPSTGRNITIPVPPVFNVDEVIRSVKAVLVSEGAERSRVKRDADLALRLEKRKEEMARVFKRRRDDEFVMLIN